MPNFVQDFFGRDL